MNPPRSELDQGCFSKCRSIIAGHQQWLLGVPESQDLPCFLRGREDPVNPRR